MQPYVIKRGDFLAKLAYRFGFDADAVWNDEQNKDLKALRKNPNILFPSDVLKIPDQLEKQPAGFDLTAGTTNTFVSDVPTVTITIRFGNSALASQSYSVQELPALTGLTTGGDGTATFEIPITLPRYTVVFTDSGMTFPVDVGWLDPINTLSGVFQRLQNLGHIEADSTLDETDIDTIRVALSGFTAAAGAEGANATLTDDGQLDDATTQLLVTAHGV